MDGKIIKNHFPTLSIFNPANQSVSKESHSNISDTSSSLVFSNCLPPPPPAPFIYQTHFSLSETQLISFPLSDIHFDKAKATVCMTEDLTLECFFPFLLNLFYFIIF